MNNKDAKIKSTERVGNMVVFNPSNLMPEFSEKMEELYWSAMDREALTILQMAYDEDEQISSSAFAGNSSKLQKYLDDNPICAGLVLAIRDLAIQIQISGDAADKAKARHLPTYAKRDEIISYWRDNIGVNVSNELAAEQLQKQFPEIAHRTLARYVSEAKKISPAGTL